MYTKMATQNPKSLFYSYDPVLTAFISCYLQKMGGFSKTIPTLADSHLHMAKLQPSESRGKP